jgi:mono/diheme cytochrome c family protein
MAGVLAGTVLLSSMALAQDAQKGTDAPNIQRGQALYEYWCASCHGRGPGHPGTQALAERYAGTVPDALEDRKNLTPKFVAVFVRTGISIMPFFRKTEISDAELAHIGAYLSRNTPK